MVAAAYAARHASVQKPAPGQATISIVGGGENPVKLFVNGTTYSPAKGQRVTIPLRAGTMAEINSILVTPKAQHRYRVTGDPCCGFALWDDDDVANRLPRQPQCTKAGGECPPGFAATPSWGARRDPRCEEWRCIRTPRVRFRIATSAASGGAIKIKLGAEGGDESAVAPPERYVSAGGVRPGQPYALELIQGNHTTRYNVLLQFDLRYTIELDGPALKMRLLLDE
jgi:hypothetical protein